MDFDCMNYEDDVGTCPECGEDMPHGLSKCPNCWQCMGEQERPYCRDAGNLILHPGDIVTRTGADEYEIMAINKSGDLITVRCLSDSAGIYENGEIESNLPRRYSFLRKGSSGSEMPNN